jgi:hypothetical protein
MPGYPNRAGFKPTRTIIGQNQNAGNIGKKIFAVCAQLLRNNGSPSQGNRDRLKADRMRLAALVVWFYEKLGYSHVFPIEIGYAGNVKRVGSAS